MREVLSNDSNGQNHKYLHNRNLIPCYFERTWWLLWEGLYLKYIICIFTQISVHYNFPHSFSSWPTRFTRHWGTGCANTASLSKLGNRRFRDLFPQKCKKLNLGVKFYLLTLTNITTLSYPTLPLSIWHFYQHSHLKKMWYTYLIQREHSKSETSINSSGMSP